MEFKVSRWQESDPPSEADLRAKLDQEGLQPYRWSNGPGDVYGAHSHPYHKLIYVLRGSIGFGLPDLEVQVDLSAGDRLALPAGIRHDALVGPQGVACLEAHR